MSYDPMKRDASWTMVRPGLYVDPAGIGHVFPDEVIAQLQIDSPDAGFDFTPEDYDLIVSTVVNLVSSKSPGSWVKFVRHDRSAA
jgi:hypothetical protein